MLMRNERGERERLSNGYGEEDEEPYRALFFGLCWAGNREEEEGNQWQRKERTHMLSTSYVK